MLRDLLVSLAIVAGCGSATGRPDRAIPIADLAAGGDMYPLELDLACPYRDDGGACCKGEGQPCTSGLDCCDPQFLVCEIDNGGTGTCRIWIR